MLAHLNKLCMYAIFARGSIGLKATCVASGLRAEAKNWTNSQWTLRESRSHMAAHYSAS